MLKAAAHTQDECVTSQCRSQASLEVTPSTLHTHKIQRGMSQLRSQDSLEVISSLTLHTKGKCVMSHCRSQASLEVTPSTLHTQNTMWNESA